MVVQRVRRAHWICILYCISGGAGLIYETVWIRAFALSFGNTLLSFSTVISVFLGGLAIGAALGGRLRINHPILLYGAAELWISGYALAIPWLINLSLRWLAPLYGSTGDGVTQVAIVRCILCALILLPATIPMGAGLPWLIESLGAEGIRAPRLIWLYALNTLGGAAGAILAGFIALPHMGYIGTLMTASSLDAAVGLAAIRLGGSVVVAVRPALEVQRSGTPLRILALVAFFSGWTAMLYEVVGVRVAGLLFGPTAATVTVTLAAVLVGLAAGGVLASLISKFAIVWLSASQLVVALLLLGTSYAIGGSPVWLAEQIRAYGQVEILEATLVFLLLFPLTMAAGMALPLAMSHLHQTAQNAGRALGGLYGVNTTGCIAGALISGWFLVPHLGAERTLYVGALVNAGLGIVLMPRFKWRVAGGGIALVTLAVLFFPRWDMAAMTSGAYKYAPYYSGSASDDINAELHNGELEFLREGPAGTVTVRRIGNSQVLAIDGKVDATDSGGDLLTEKLLAHLPLSLIANPRNICVIGLASGVTAGAALTYPVSHLDVLEVSREVVEASRFFDRVSGKPLDSSRTRLIVNDGRNHLALTPQKYDAILSEPSNPWISGMNAMFTRDFFRIARRRLNPGGVMAQWFHLYNMPPDDLRSLLRAFTDVFPAATLWQLNEGDVLLTSVANDHLEEVAPVSLPAAALDDLAQAGVSEPDLLPMLYVMRGADLARFAGGAEPNTDDFPVLEFHGQRDLDLQTSERNIQELAAFPKQALPPREVREVRNHMIPERHIARARMFERAESYRLAFVSYQKAHAERPGDSNVLAGMLRCAKSPDEIAAAGTLSTRTTEALNDARNGDLSSAESLLRAVKQAWPERPEAHLNYGLFCFERSHYAAAIQSFNDAIHADPHYLPAFEAMAKTYLRERDLRNAAVWSRRILEIDPGHTTARQVLAAIEQRPASR
jgi:spermidine synthase